MTDAPSAPEPPSRAKLAMAAAVALLVAGVLLATVVLPAEYGIDPLGTGEALGLTALSAAGDGPAVRSDGLTAQPGSYRLDRRTFQIAPGSFVEYKFRLEEGEAMVYSWIATDSVRSEMHSEEDGAPEGTAEFFEVEEAALERHGSYVAPFPGIHGWYWLNETEDTVRVTMHAAGFFDESLEFLEESALPWRYQITETPSDSDAEAAPDDAGEADGETEDE